MRKPVAMLCEKEKKKKSNKMIVKKDIPVFEKNEQVLSSMIHCRLHLFFLPA